MQVIGAFAASQHTPYMDALQGRANCTMGSVATMTQRYSCDVPGVYLCSCGTSVEEPDGGNCDDRELHEPAGRI